MSETDVQPEAGAKYSTPRWVKVFGIIALVLVVLIGIIALAGGEHSPARHLSPASVTESSVHTPPVEHGLQQP